MVDTKKYGFSPCGAVPNERQLAHYKIGKKAFFHFGVNTFTDNEWGDGSERESLFNPTALDTDQWIKAIKDAGFKLAIITAKHHDGFCLWPSKYTEHSVKNSPYKSGKGDVIKEFTDSCRKYGIKAGLYVSPWDRYSPLWGKDSYSDFYAKQLTELMTSYGEIHEVWWDGAGSTETRYDWEHWESIIRKYQPNAAIFGSLGASEYVDLRWVGNEFGSAGKTHYATIDPYYLLNETPAVLNVGDPTARKFIPSETDVSIRPGWFYHSDHDNFVKSPSILNKIWFESVGRNSVLLLNFPPDKSGRLCQTDIDNAIASEECISKMLSVNYAEGARISNDTPITPITVQDTTTNVRLRVYQGNVFDIVLPKPTLINVFTAGELIDAGERITSFRLESIDESDNATLLYDGTSVGYYRAVQFPKAEYSHLRFTVTSSLATPLLKDFGLHLFVDAEKREGNASLSNLVRRIEVSEDKCTATVRFSGIFPFNEVSFNTCAGSECEIATFNGHDFETVAKATAKDKNLTVRLNEAVVGSYQVRVSSSAPIEADTITVKYV